MRAADIFDLTGGVALVTGASSGLGYRFARVLAANGATVICAARRLERLERLAAEIEADGGRALAIEMDATDTASISAAFDRAEAEAGVPTIVVNNAGVAKGGWAIDMADADWRQVMDVNLDGVFFVAREAARRLRDAGKEGSIVNMASILGLGVSRGLTAYAVSKAAVVQMTKALAVEFGRHGIRVNALAPGYFESEMTGGYLDSDEGKAVAKRIPLGRHGREGELDGALLLLVSNAGSHMTGVTLPVDGGHSLEIV